MHVVIIGNGCAGVNAAIELRKQDSEATISIISDETDYHYSRTALMWGYTGQLAPRDMEPFERSFWDQMKFDRIRKRVSRIDPAAKKIRFDDLSEANYDKLLLATGGAPNMFGWPGQELDGVGNFTNMRHLETLIGLKPRIKRAVIVGGGLIGIELVEIMLHHGVETTFLLREPWYWKLMLHEREARIVEGLIEQAGAKVIHEDEIGSIEGENGRVARLVTKGGKTIDCDYVGIAVGVHANTELCKDAGIAIGRGIIVDPSMKSSVPDIWAAGDCAEIHYPGQEGPVAEQLWYTGIKQGVSAARSICGEPVRYERGIAYNSAQFMTYDFCTVGQMKQFRPDAQEEIAQGKWNGDKDWTCRIAHENQQVVGLAMLGPRWDSQVMIRWIQERRSPEYCMANLSDALFNEEFVRGDFAGGRHE
jgi:NADH oxidase (H2O2-forming)